MNKLYAGIAATALAAAGLACSAGAASATTSPWPSPLQYAPQSWIPLSTAISTDGTALYTAAVNADTDGVVDVSSTDLGTGKTTHTLLTLEPSTGFDEINYVGAVAVTSTGVVLASAEQDGSDDSDSGIWRADVGDTTASETITGVNANDVLAVSANGQHAALYDGLDIDTFDTTGTSATTVSVATGGADEVDVQHIAVADNGGVYAAGRDLPNGYTEDGDDEADSQPKLWKVDAGATSATSHDLADYASSVALAGSKVLVGETHITESTDPDEGDTETSSLEVFGTDIGASAAPTSTALTYDPQNIAVSPGGKTVFTTNGYWVERINLDALASYTPDNPVPAGEFGDDVWDVSGIAATGNALYAVTGSESDDDDDETWAVSRVTKPGDVIDSTQTVYDDGSIDLQWKAPADNGGADLTYVVTLTDQDGNVITDEVTDPYDYLDAADKGLRAGATYDITITAENAAFASDGITVPPVLSGTAKVTVSGTAVVGGTLTATGVKFTARGCGSVRWTSRSAAKRSLKRLKSSRIGGGGARTITSARSIRSSRRTS